MSISHKFRALRKAIASVASVAIFTMAVTVAPQASAQTFNDVSPSHWAYDYVEQLVTDGVIDANDNYRPDDNLNRAELVKIAVEATTGIQTDLIPATPTFDDVSADAWYYQYVETAAALGIVEGYKDASGNLTGLFGPSDMVNRAAATKILVNAYGVPTDTDPAGIFSDVEDGAWYYEYVTTAYNQSIIDGYKNTGGELTGLFGPGDPVTRAQVAKLAVNSQTPTERVVTDDEDEDTTDDEDVTESEGDLEVSVSADTPESTTVPYDATGVEVAKFDFTAAGDDVVLQGLNITREGVGSDSGWELYLYDGADRLTSAKTINSTTHQAVFTNVNLDIEAGETKTITVKAETSSTASGNNTFTIASEDDVNANTDSVAGDFPLQSNVMEVSSSIQAGGVTIEKSGSITNPKVGEDEVTIAKFKLTTAREAGTLTSIALIVDGTVSATDVENAKLYQGGTEIASVDMVNSKDLLVFTLDDGFEIAKGDSRIFEVKADLNTGRSADTVNVYLDEDTDLVITGGTYGYGMKVTNTSYDGTGTNYSTSTLQGGDITISSSGPSANDVAINGDDVALMNFSVAAGSEATFKKFAISLTPTELLAAGGFLNNTTNNITDIKISNKDTGDVLMGPVDADDLVTALGGSTAITEAAGDNAVAYYVFQDEFSMEAGEELNLVLSVDVENNASLANDTVSGKIEIDGSYPEIKDVNNKTVTNGTSVVPSSDITGKTMTITTPGLTVSLASSPVTDEFVKGTKNVCFAGFSMRAGNASDVKVTDMTVTGLLEAADAFAAFATGGSDTVGLDTIYVKDIVGSLKLMDNEGNQLGSTESVQSNGTVSFDSVDFTVDAGATELVKVCGDINSSITAKDYVKFGLAASSITAEDEDGNSISSLPAAAINQATDVTGTYVTATDGGSITVAVDADTAKENIAVAGTADVDVSKFRITTTDEAFVVTKLSINNRQSAATALGDYDNNVASIQISYTNSDGDTETKTGYLTDGVAQFSGLDMFIDKDEDAILTVKATLNTISQGASATEFVDLNLAFNNFEAVAQGSGETYKASKLDEQTTATSDLDFGTMTFVDTGATHAASADAVTLGSSATLTVPDLNVSLPVGTLVKFGAESTTYAEGTDVLVVLTTKYTDGDLTLTGLVANNDDGDANGDEIYYALPGTGYLTSANMMHVKETKPTVVLDSASPSGSRNVASSDQAFIFKMTADAKEKVSFGTSTDFATCIAGGGSTLTNPAQTAITVDGSACEATAMNANGDSMAYANTVNLANYGYASFWFRWHDNDANVATFEAGDLGVFTADANDGTEDNTRALVATNVGGSATYFVEDTWYFVQDVAMPSGTDATDTFIGLYVVDATAQNEATDDIFIDQFRVYNEKITVNISADEDFDRTYDQSTTSVKTPTVAYLKEGGSVVATGYIDTLAVDANADGAEDGTDGSKAVVTFIPTSSAIEISKATSKTFTLETNTSNLLAEDASTDDSVTFSMNLGTSTDGTVTAGNIWWNDTNVTTKWCGQVSSTTLNGNNLKY